MNADLRSLVRELLVEELARMKNESVSRPREEHVRIDNDSDLALFTRKVLQIAASPGGADDILKGRLVFRLQQQTGAGPAADGAHANGRPDPQQSSVLPLGKSLISERDVNSLPRHVGTVSIDSQSMLTPLAKDELRRRGIKIKRKSS